MSTGHPLKHHATLLIGVGLLLFSVFSPALPNLSHEATKVALLAVAMSFLWVTEAIPIPATALLPIVLLPLSGVSSVGEATSPYADPIIYLFMGGFMLSIAMERWNLHRRLALRIICVFGTKPRSLVLGFLVSAAFLSMWVSNSATAMMLLPIAISVHGILKRDASLTAPSSHLGSALVLAIAYGANIGGMGTLIGTPPNAILKGFLERTYGIHISFADWMKLGVPLVILSVPLAHLILTRVSFRVQNDDTPGLKSSIDQELTKLGKTTRPEWIVLLAFSCAVVAWITRGFWKSSYPFITDEVIAMTAATTLFFIPAELQSRRFVLDWDAVRKIPWDVLILFGGGLSLASAFEKTKLAESMAGMLNGLASWPALWIVFLVVAVMIIATALTSNTATTAAFLPVIGALAVTLDLPILLLTAPVALAASADFMLPVGTPPNAIAYGSGLVPLPRMIRSGLWVDLLFLLLIPLLMWTIGRWVFSL